jgi:hypothetical protein
MKSGITPRGTVPPKLPDAQRHTRDLLGELHKIRAEMLEPAWDTEVPLEWTDEHKAKNKARTAELQAELATREHVPGPLEGKTHRQKAASMNRGQGKSRNK